MKAIDMFWNLQKKWMDSLSVAHGCSSTYLRMKGMYMYVYVQYVVLK